MRGLGDSAASPVRGVLPSNHSTHRERFDRDPTDRRAFEALEESAFVSGNWEDLVTLYERRLGALGQEDGNAERAVLRHRLGRVHAERRDAPEEARAAWRGALDADPTFRPALADLRADALQREQWEIAIQILDFEIALERNPVDRGRLHALAGETWLDALDDAEQALAQFDRALDALPRDVGLLECSARAAARCDPPERAAAYWERVAAATNGAARARARVAQAEWVDSERATTLYRGALTDDPRNSDALCALAALAEREARWALAVDLHERRYEAASDATTRLEAAKAAVRIHASELPDPDAARLWLARAAVDTGAPEKLDTLRENPAGLATPAPPCAGDQEAWLDARCNEAAATDDSVRLGELVPGIVRAKSEQGNFREALEWVERWLSAAPETVEALRLAAELHERLEQDAELVAALERMDPLLDRNDQAANRGRLGDVHAAYARHDLAVNAYRSALEADPYDVRIHEAIVDLLRDSGAPEVLAGAYRDLAEHCPEPRRTEARDALARLLEESLGDLAGAADVLALLVDSVSPPADAYPRLESLLERTARHEELAKHLARRLDTAEESIRPSLLRRRAETLLDHLGDPEAAVATYRQLLEETPDDDDAHIGLERSLRAAGDLAGLVDFLAARAARLCEPGARDPLDAERAEILIDELDRPSDAAGILDRLSREAESAQIRRDAAARLEPLLEHAGNWDALRLHWQARLETEGESETVTLHEKLGTLSRDRHQDTETAAGHFEAAARLAPERTDLWRALARIYETEHRPAELARVLESELASGVTPEQERSLSSRIAALCTSALGDPRRARRHYERLIELDPDNAAAHDYLIERWEEEGHLLKVAQLLECRLDALAAQSRDDTDARAAQRTSLRLRIAEIRANALQDTDGAIAVLEPGLGEVGPLAAVADPLADLYRHAGYSSDLVALCENAAEACPPGTQRATWLKRLGMTLRERGDEGRATGAYRRALDTRPGDADAEAALRALYRNNGDAASLAALLETQLDRLNGPDEIPVRLELAALRRDRLDEPDGALSELRRVVWLDPGHREAISTGLDLAEQLARGQVARELLDTALARRQPGALRADLLERRGRLLAEEPDQSERAIADFDSCLEIDPARDAVRASLRALHESRNDWRGALACRLIEARRATGDERLAHLEVAAESAWRELSADDALPWLERLRQEAPDRTDVLERIASVHAANRRPQCRLHALEALIEHTEDAMTRRDLWCDCARLLEHELGHPRRAARALENARRLFPEDSEILCTLDRIYAATGRYRERAEILAARAALATGDARAPLLLEAAALYAERLSEPQAAAALLLQAVAQTPPKDSLYPELLRLLGDALRQSGPPDAWARCAETELASLATGGSVFDERRNALRAELAAWYRRAARPEAALPHLHALVDQAPSDLAVKDAHETELLAALSHTGNSVELERRLASHLERTGGDAEAWLELGGLRERQLSATGAAAAAYRRALDLEPQAPIALAAVRRCAERLGRWEEVVETLDAELETLEVSATRHRAELLRQRGDVQWRRLGSTTQASLAYAAAIEACPEDLEALRSLQRLLEAVEDWQGAVALHESEVAVLGARDTDRRYALWLRVGDIARDHLGDMDRAVRAFRAAADIAPLSLERQRETAEYFGESGDLETFAELFANWCDAPESPAEATDHLRLAETWEALGFTEQAGSRVAQALTLETGNPRAWRLAARLHETAGDEAAAAEAWRHAAETTPGPEAADSWRRAAALSADRETLILLREAAAADPTAWAVQSDLARAALQAERWREAETAAARALSVCEADPPDPTGVCDIALAGARAARVRGREERAVDFFEQALAVDPDCLEALAGAGECCLAIGEPERAQELLERRIAQSTRANPQLLALLGRCLAETGRPEAALDRCEEALARDPALEEAHRLCVALHREAGRVDPGIAALERWAARQPAEERSALLLRAAEWELESGDREAAAERHLQDAVQADPKRARAWQRLAEVFSRNGRNGEAAAAAETGLAAENPDGCDRGALELQRARALEAAGKHRSATDAFRQASRVDPNSFEAVDSGARLLRAAGNWRGAAEALDHFARNADAVDTADLVSALHQLGSLLEGPLDDRDAAVEVYQRAVELAPEHAELSMRLGNVLAQKAETRSEALEHYAAILEREPTRSDALLRTLELARAQGDPLGIETGCALLSAIGVPFAPSSAPGTGRLGMPIAQQSGLEEPLGEALRTAVHQVAVEIGRALRAPTALSEPEDGAERVARFRSTALAIQAELTAPGLLPLPTLDVRDLVCCLATLALSPESVRAPGATLNALAGAIGRRAKRRLRRALAGTDLASIAAYDFDRWREKLRALAAARAVDRLGGDLQAALEAILADPGAGETVPAGETGDFSARVAKCPEAHDLLARAVGAWITVLREEELRPTERRA